MKKMLSQGILRSLVILGIVTFAAMANLPLQQPAFADHVGDEGIILLTNNLLALVKQYLRAEAMGKEQLLPKIEDVINKRKAQLLTLLETNPDAVEHLLLPPDLVAGLPHEIKELLEVDAEFEGELTVLVQNDFDAGTVKTIYSLTDNQTKNKYILHFAGETFNLSTGTTLKVAGSQIDNHLLVAAAGSTITGGTTTAAATSYPLVTGDQKTIVMMVNFSDASVSCSNATTNNAVFGTTGTTVNTDYKESSFNGVSVSGDVVGPFTIPSLQSSATVCNDYYTWASQADTAATNSGINLSNYTRKIYVVPSISCGWAGMGTIGGNPSRSWIMGSYCSYPTVIAHELGHNLGMHHASTGSLTAMIAEYGDRSDIMGSTYVGSFPYYAFEQNAPHKISMGWIPSGRVQPVTTDGTFTLDSVENGFPSNPQALKIHKTDTNEDYYISFRQPIGFDAGLESTYKLKTNIHRWNGNTSTQTFYLNSVDDGMSFVDTTNAITVKQLSHTDSQATVSVTFGTPVCNRVNPLISLSPASATGPAGGTLNYSISVTNQNSVTCPAGNFQLSSVLPANWVGTFSPATISLSPGTSGSAVMSVTSDPSAVDASYLITAKATDVADANFNSSKNATYVVFTDIAAPTVAVTSPLNGATVSGKINIAVSASDNVKVNSVGIYIDGTLKVTDTTAPYSYAWNNAAAGTHTIFAKAYDSSNNVGTSPTISVSVSSSKGGGKPTR